MNAPIPPEEFAALVGASPEQVERWRREGLLDPEGTGRLEELDLVRWLTIHSYEARGYRFVSHADWRPHTNYRSVILSLALPAL